MKWLAAALAVAVILLQYRIWLSDDGVRQVTRLRQAVAAQRTENERLTERNRQLGAEVHSLQGADFVEVLRQSVRSPCRRPGLAESMNSCPSARPRRIPAAPAGLLVS